MKIVILLIQREMIRSSHLIKCAKRADQSERKVPKPGSELTRGPTKPHVALRGVQVTAGLLLPLNIPLL